jgi:protein involved in polysaccharide export with SLBB domain/capsular polysaccharide biosynthesis protein
MREEDEYSTSELHHRQKERERAPSQKEGGGSNGHADEFVHTRPRNSRQEALQPKRIALIEMAPPEGEPIRLPLDPVRLFDVLKQRWYLWLTAGLLLGALGFFYAYWQTRSSVSMELMRLQVPALFRASETGDPFRPQAYFDQTLIALMRSPEVIQRVTTKAGFPVSPRRLSSSLLIDTERESDLVMVTLIGMTNAQMAVDLLNLYAEEFVEFTREMQRREAQEMIAYLEEKITRVEKDLAVATQEFNALPQEAKTAQIDKLTETYLVQLTQLEYEIAQLEIEKAAANPVADRLVGAEEELATMLRKWTDQHPEVTAHRAYIASLRKQIEGSETSRPRNSALERKQQQYEELLSRVQNKLDGLTTRDASFARLKTRFASLEMLRSMLASRQREAQLFQENALGYYRILNPATIERVDEKGYWRKGIILAIAGALAGIFAIAGLIVANEVLDDRIKTRVDLERVTDLPVLATLGNLNRMDEAAKTSWAFRTWTILKGKLSASQTQGFVCGFISAKHGEGRSTWINLLVKTANERGLRVLTIATRASEDPKVHPHEHAEAADTSTTLSPNVFAFPAQVTQKLSGPDALPVVHIPLPGWVWNLERRQQWQSALSAWRKIDNLALLVELPPACEPEGILLAENIPQLIWFSSSGKVTFKETREHLETLRHIGCNLVGTALNKEPESAWRKHYNRWFATGLLLGALHFFASDASQLHAQQRGIREHFIPMTEQQRRQELLRIEAEVERARRQREEMPATSESEPPLSPAPASVPPAGMAADPQPPGAPSQKPNMEETAEEDRPLRTSAFFSVSNPNQRAQWQQRLTLGPGDIVHISFFGQTNLNRTDVPIGPDGRISYLQADVPALGLTVDELREKLEHELATFYRAPRLILTPQSYRSKRYIVLGRVQNRGVYVLNRPLTILEAVARANGLETGLLNQDSIDLADLQRSFLIRRGERIPINFEKLFYEGDLSQNIPIEPDDFLYFPPANLKEVYVVGELRQPGVVMYTADVSAIAAIARRGGFTDRAFKSRVLVIRGSINNPETFVVDTLAILDGRAADFQLEPRDIVYVSYRPFFYAEELLDLAATAFIQSAVTAWTGVNIGPFITKPFLPRL